MISEADQRQIHWIPPWATRSQHFERPFYTFLLKVASRCNIDCDYCYVYRSPDQSWRLRPKLLSTETLVQTSFRIAEHVERHHLQEIDIVFHGGEPLMLGSRRLDELITYLRSSIPCQINFGMQSNGTLLSPKILDLLYSHNVSLGLSLDGPKEVNDRHRIDHKGQGTFDRIVRAVTLSKSRKQWSTLIGNYLAVVDIRNDVNTIYEFFQQIGAKSIDLILPDAHHGTPPPRSGATLPEYGIWLSKFFDLWYGQQPDMDVKLFDEILVGMLGGPSNHESIGAKSVDIIVIETDGAIEPVDTLKVVGREATDIGLDVFRNSFDDALAHPAVRSRMSGYSVLCEECRQCSHLQYCGGGYLPHRYSDSNSFDNPSVYCEDLKYLFRHIMHRVGVASLVDQL